MTASWQPLPPPPPPTSTPWYRRWWGVALIILGLFVIIGVLTDDDETPSVEVASEQITREPEPEPEPEPDPEPASEPELSPDGLTDDQIRTLFEVVWDGHTTEEQTNICMTYVLYGPELTYTEFGWDESVTLSQMRSFFDQVCLD